MGQKKFIVGCFDDETALFPVIKEMRTAGYKIYDVYTPFAVHGLDHALGIRETKLHTAGFIYGITGTITALAGMAWITSADWRHNYGGKPSFALPAFIPITFELTVLFAAVGMVVTFCWLCKIAPFAKKHHFHKNSTDNFFVMAIECTNTTDEDDVKNILSDAGAAEIETQVAETGWWWGLYNK